MVAEGKNQQLTSLPILIYITGAYEIGEALINRFDVLTMGRAKYKWGLMAPFVFVVVGGGESFRRVRTRLLRRGIGL